MGASSCLKKRKHETYKCNLSNKQGRKLMHQVHKHIFQQATLHPIVYHVLISANVHIIVYFRIHLPHILIASATRLLEIDNPSRCVVTSLRRSAPRKKITSSIACSRGVDSASISQFLTSPMVTFCSLIESSHCLMRSFHTPALFRLTKRATSSSCCPLVFSSFPESTQGCDASEQHEQKDIFV